MNSYLDSMILIANPTTEYYWIMAFIGSVFGSMLLSTDFRHEHETGKPHGPRAYLAIVWASLAWPLTISLAAIALILLFAAYTLSVAIDVVKVERIND